MEALALPFTFGMALGLAFGRVVLQSTVLGVLLGIVLVGLFVAVRSWLVS